MNNYLRLGAPAIAKALLLLTAVAHAVAAEQHCQPDNIIATAPAKYFTVNPVGTVTDQRHGLEWKTCVEGLSGEACSEGEVLKLNWAEALLYLPKFNAEGGFAGKSDWRIANIRELSTLVESQCITPAINLELFPATPAEHTWTSSPYHFYTHYSWYVDFRSGIPTYDERIREKALRLVRSVQ